MDLQDKSHFGMLFRPCKSERQKQNRLYRRSPPKELGEDERSNQSCSKQLSRNLDIAVGRFGVWTDAVHRLPPAKRPFPNLGDQSIQLFRPFVCEGGRIETNDYDLEAKERNQQICDARDGNASGKCCLLKRRDPS